MEDLNEKYDQITEQREKIIAEMKKLEENEVLKRYFELKKENENLYDNQLDLFRKIKMEEYAACKHILVYSKIDYDRYEGRTYRRCGCIKCGLDNRVLDESRDWLSYSQKIMYDYLKKRHIFGHSWGIQTGIICDIDLAQAIYAKIKKAYPDIDDATAIKFFQYSLSNIRNVKVNEERKVSRAKRLELNPKFQRWNIGDIENY